MTSTENVIYSVKKQSDFRLTLYIIAYMVISINQLTKPGCLKCLNRRIAVCTLPCRPTTSLAVGRYIEYHYFEYFSDYIYIYISLFTIIMVAQKEKKLQPKAKNASNTQQT